MTLHRLRVFVTAAKHLNLSNAACALRVSQPAISHELKRLEQDLQVRLVNRTSRGIELTDNGTELLRDLEPILTQLDGMTAKYTQRAIIQVEGELRFGASHGPSINLVPSLTARFQKSGPVFRFIYKTGTSSEIEDLVSKKRIELALVSNPTHSSSMVTEPYSDERLVLVVSKHHPRAKQSTLTAAELATLPLIVGTGRDGVSATLDILCRHLAPNIGPNVSLRVESPEALISAVVAGAGIGVLYEDMAITELRKGTLTKLNLVGMNLNGQIYLIYRRDAELSRVAVEFITFLREQRVLLNNDPKDISPAKRTGGLPKPRNLSVANAFKIFPMVN